MISVLLIVLLVGIAIGIDFYKNVFTPYAGYGNPIYVEIPKGASAASIARILHKNKVISGYYHFRIYYRLFFGNLTFKSGEYLFDRPMTMHDVIEKLHEGKVALFKLTVQEGLSIPEIAELAASHPSLHISSDAFIREARSGDLIRELDPTAPDLEGYLFPDTYMLRRNVTAQELVGMMVDRFKENFTKPMEQRSHEMDFSIRKAVTMASLIEKETASSEERYLISSVFHNRLKIQMALACDPTVIYALKRDNAYKGKLGWAALRYDSPYNTRIYRGLPPGPICSPGVASIKAALYPPQTNYLYFVAENPQKHYFSESLDEHNRAVRKFIINRGKEEKKK